MKDTNDITKVHQELPYIKRYKQVWSGEYEYVPFEICFWETPHMKDDDFGTYPNQGIWNSYIVVLRDSIPDYFDRLLPETEEWRDHIYRNPVELDSIFEMQGGVTFCETITNEKQDIIGLKVGNDYNHIWNGGEGLVSVYDDVGNSIDNYLRHFPNRKVRSIIDGVWVDAGELEDHNKKANERLKIKSK